MPIELTTHVSKWEQRSTWNEPAVNGHIHDFFWSVNLQTVKICDINIYSTHRHNRLHNPSAHHSEKSATCIYMYSTV